MSTIIKQPKHRWSKVAMVVLLLIVAVIVIPNFVRARTTRAGNACINNLRQMDGAIQQWSLGYQKRAVDKITMPDITPYMSHEFQCQQGGKYSIGPAVSNGVSCSFPGHALPH